MIEIKKRNKKTIGNKNVRVQRRKYFSIPVKHSILSLSGMGQKLAYVFDANSIDFNHLFLAFLYLCRMRMKIESYQVD